MYKMDSDFDIEAFLKEIVDSENGLSFSEIESGNKVNFEDLNFMKTDSVTSDNCNSNEIPLKIPSYNDLLKEIENVKVENEKLRKQLISLNDSANKVRLMYEKEHATLIKITEENEKLNAELSKCKDRTKKLMKSIDNDRYMQEQSIATWEVKWKDFNILLEHLVKYSFSVTQQLIDSEILTAAKKKEIQSIKCKLIKSNFVVPDLKFSILNNKNLKTNLTNSVEKTSRVKVSENSSLNSLEIKNKKDKSTQYVCNSITRGVNTELINDFYNTDVNFPESIEVGKYSSNNCTISRNLGDQIFGQNEETELVHNGSPIMLLWKMLGDKLCSLIRTHDNALFNYNKHIVPFLHKAIKSTENEEKKEGYFYSNKRSIATSPTSDYSETQFSGGSGEEYSRIKSDAYFETLQFPKASYNKLFSFTNNNDISTFHIADEKKSIKIQKNENDPILSINDVTVKHLNCTILNSDTDNLNNSHKEGQHKYYLKENEELQIKKTCQNDSYNLSDSSDEDTCLEDKLICNKEKDFNFLKVGNGVFEKYEKCSQNKLMRSENVRLRNLSDNFLNINESSVDMELNSNSKYSKNELCEYTKLESKQNKIPVEKNFAKNLEKINLVFPNKTENFSNSNFINEEVKSDMSTNPNYEKEFLLKTELYKNEVTTNDVNKFKNIFSDLFGESESKSPKDFSSNSLQQYLNKSQAENFCKNQTLNSLQYDLYLSSSDESSYDVCLKTDLKKHDNEILKTKSKPKIGNISLLKIEECQILDEKTDCCEEKKNVHFQKYSENFVSSATHKKPAKDVRNNFSKFDEVNAVEHCGLSNHSFYVSEKDNKSKLNEDKISKDMNKSDIKNISKMVSSNILKSKNKLYDFKKSENAVDEILKLFPQVKFKKRNRNDKQMQLKNIKNRIISNECLTEMGKIKSSSYNFIKKIENNDKLKFKCSSSITKKSKDRYPEIENHRKNKRKLHFTEKLENNKNLNEKSLQYFKYDGALRNIAKTPHLKNSIYFDQEKKFELKSYAFDENEDFEKSTKKLKGDTITDKKVVENIVPALSPFKTKASAIKLNHVTNEIENITLNMSSNKKMLTSVKIIEGPLSTDVIKNCNKKTPNKTFSENDQLLLSNKDLYFCPASPTHISDEIYDAIEIPSERIYFEKSGNQFKTKKVASFVETLLKSFNPLFQKNIIENNNLSKSKIKADILIKLKNILYHYIHSPANTEQVKKCIFRLLKITKVSKLICKGILEIIEFSDNITTKSAEQSETQGKIIVLINKFNSHIKKFKQNIIHQIHHKIFSLKPNKIALKNLMNLIKFNIILMDLQDLQTNKDDRKMARLLIFKCFYYYHIKAIPMVFELLVSYPSVLPRRNDPFYNDSDPIIKTLQSILNSISFSMSKSDLRHHEMFYLLKDFYNYERVKPGREELIDFLLIKIISNELENISFSLAVICKHHGFEWAQNFVIEQKIVPLLNVYYTKIFDTDENDKQIECIFESLSFILKAFPLDFKNIEKYLQIFKNFLFATNRKCIQQAAVCAILRTSRFGLVNTFTAILHWKPDFEVDKLVKLMIQTFLYKKPLFYWRKIHNQIKE